MSPDSESESQSIDRRVVLRRGAAVGAIVWTAPVVQSLTWSAAAGENQTTVGSPRPCVVRFKIHFCRTYKHRTYKNGRHGYSVTQKWFEVTLPFDLTGECCELVNQVVVAYQSSSRTEYDCLWLIFKLIKSGCFRWEDWMCRVDDDYHGGDD
jgi:hypothetical protein